MLIIFHLSNSKYLALIYIDEFDIPFDYRTLDLYTPDSKCMLQLSKTTDLEYNQIRVNFCQAYHFLLLVGKLYQEQRMIKL